MRISNRLVALPKKMYENGSISNLKIPYQPLLVLHKISLQLYTPLSSYQV